MQEWLQVAGKLRRIPMIGLFVGLGALWWSWPVVALDFDLWYHLAGGAYIAEHLRLPAGPFFSFIPTENTWLDYYWLYQLLVHGLYSAAGYPALIAFRGVVFLTSVGCVYIYLRNSCRSVADKGYLPVLVLTCAYALALQPRDLLLRPHAITYLFIVFIHYVLNYKQGIAWLLPVLTVVWANIHGVEYPVLLLVYGAYLGEYFLDAWLARPQKDRLRLVRWPVIISLYAVLVTPAGLSLLAKPFASPPFHEMAVIELARQPLAKFLGFFFYPDSRLVETASNGLVLGAVVAALGLAALRSLRAGRLVLLAGGLVLLPMMQRFTFEFIVLVLPLLGDALAALLERSRRQWDGRIIAGLSLAVVVLTLWTSNAYLGNRPYYPVDQSRLPEGVCNFLMSQGPGGRIYNVPNPGGYLEWRLYPKYTIGMDMQTMLFSTSDLYCSTSAFGDKTILEKIIAQYDPGFLLSYVGDKEFRKVVAVLPQFEQIYFDDVLVLYADKSKYADLVREYRLEVLDHFDWQSEDFEKMDAQKRKTAMFECQRLLQFYPEGLTANAIAAKILLAEGNFTQAGSHADTLIHYFPDRFMGYSLKGLVAFKQNRFEDSLRWQQQALPRAMPSETEAVRRNIYASYVRLGAYDKAYKTLLEVCNPMRVTTSAKDLYDLALSALAAGHAREGKVLLGLARLKAGEKDVDILKDIDGLEPALHDNGNG